MQISSQRRIGLASSLVIACIGVALAVTVWSYRNAVHARSVALGAVREETTAQTAETYLWRQREVMNEYLLTSSPGLLAEARAMERGFEREISQVGVGEPEETGLVTRAIRADKRLVATFQPRILVAGDGSAGQAASQLRAQCGGGRHLRAAPRTASDQRSSGTRPWPRRRQLEQSSPSRGHSRRGAGDRGRACLRLVRRSPRQTDPRSERGAP